MSTGISVLIPTHNRAETLRHTLERMAQLDRTGLDAEFVVIANACSDTTEAVVASFAGRLPVRCLVEPRPGKNRALNRALADPGLREIVVFTDDDVDPAPDWLQAIAATCARWPDQSVFGGRIQVVWPGPRVPSWALDRYVQEFGFTVHDYAPEECLYDARRVPVGPNFWLRRSVLEAGWRFEEAIGPHPSNRILGDETHFLRQLRAGGYAMVYSPHAVVGHRIQPEVLTVRGIRWRAYTLGRGIAHSHGLPRADLLRRRPWAWKALRLLGLARVGLRAGLTALWPSEAGRALRGIHAMRDLGYQVECLRLARGGAGARELSEGGSAGGSGVPEESSLATSEAPPAGDSSS